MNNRWSILFALACALVAPVAAQQPPAPGLGINSIAHVALRVSDVDREIAFLGKLGYEESFAVNNSGQIMGVIKINDRQFIELYPRTDPKQPLGFLHACYEAGDLKQLVNYYVSLGLNATPARKAGSGNLISVLTDPDGRVTEFTQYMPGSRHTLDRGQHLGADRISTELMGVDFPTNNLAAEKKFYMQLGFEAEADGNDVHLT
ncbi:MAG: VOC family protein, partial [Terracidiphilus sp.]